MRGTAGTVHLEVDARGRVIRELDREPGRPGADVVLTLDAGLQQVAMATLATRRSASAVLLDVTSGAVLAMASTPSFDPTLFESGVSVQQWKSWVDDVRAPLLNKATDGSYPPGSTFKPVVAMAALAAGVITAQTRFFCPGYLKLGNHKFYCWLHWGHGWVDLASALTQSCDVFFYNVALRTGIDRIERMAHRFAIGASPGLDLGGVAQGFVATREWWQKKGHHWTPGDTVVQGIGQGFTLATPLGLATMIARMASGRMIRPYLAARVGARPVAPPPPPPMGLPERAFAAIRAGLFGVVNDRLGTAYAERLPLPGVAMAGKTGSAQVINASTGNRGMSFHTSKLPWKYRPQALFIAYAPVSVPHYALAVVVEHGNEGAQAAAPIAREIMLAALARDGVVQSQAASPPAPA
ncbi:MAG: penicillin-binding transpeptidase domain-containing protein [Acetobacteraceae bacterium]